MSIKSRKIFCILLVLVISLICFVALSAQTTSSLDYRERFVLLAARSILSAQITFQATTGAGEFGSLMELKEAGLIDASLGGGAKHGYIFTLVRTPPTAASPARFRLSAVPRNYPKNGRRSFYIDETGSLRGADRRGAPADATDPLINECESFGISFKEQCLLRDLRSFEGAQYTYQATVGMGNFGSLPQLFAAGLINSGMASGAYYGYTLSLSTTAPGAGAPAFFTLRATPVNYGVSGTRSFYIDAEGILRGGDKRGEPADRNDPPIND